MSRMLLIAHALSGLLAGERHQNLTPTEIDTIGRVAARAGNSAYRAAQEQGAIDGDGGAWPVTIVSILGKTDVSDLDNGGALPDTLGGGGTSPPQAARPAGMQAPQAPQAPAAPQAMQAGGGGAPGAPGGGGGAPTPSYAQYLAWLQSQGVSMGAGDRPPSGPGGTPASATAAGVAAIGSVPPLPGTGAPGMPPGPEAFQHPTLKTASGAPVPVVPPPAPPPVLATGATAVAPGGGGAGGAGPGVAPGAATTVAGAAPDGSMPGVGTGAPGGGTPGTPGT